LLAILALSLSFTACNKKASSGSTSSNSTSTQTDDEAMVNNETDATSNDATAALEGVGGSFAERPEGINPFIPFPCDATITVDTISMQKTITITYNGSNCYGTRLRTGKVILSFDSTLHWQDAGAYVTVTYDSLKITRIWDGKTIMINGTKTIENVSGGLLKNLGTLNTITHNITSSGLTITFNNGAQGIWNISKQRVFTYNNGIDITTTGAKDTLGTVVAVWGINRYGNAFTSAITQPRVIEQSCDFRLVSGQTLYNGPNVTSTTTFGLDSLGNHVTACPSGLFYYEVVWTQNGKTNTFIAPY